MSGVVAGLKGLGPKRLMALGGVGLALLALLAALAMRAGDPPMAPLFGDMEARDAAAVVASLEKQRVPFRLEAGGTRVLAPADQVPRLRLTLAREGLPSGGGVGWEIFDRAESLTTTPFQQDVNRLRALEGEIARTIRGLAGVRTARVHLALPRREAFSRERGEAQASVVLAMHGAQRLDRDGVQAVLHLVATAVPGLKPSGISIVDSRGELLARGGQALSGPAGAGGAALLSQEEMRRAHEMRIGRSVEELLERTLGPGRVRAEATVEMDFDRVQTTEERFDPENQVARSQQSVNEQNRGAEPQPTTVAGNLPGGNEGQTGGAASQESRQEETTNYEIGRSTRSTTREHPTVRRLSVAVLVDGVAEPRPSAGEAPAWRERTADELARIAALVRSAIGFDERRGDRVEVVSMRFVAEPAAAAEPSGPLGLPPLSPALLTRLAESGLLALVALVGILVIGRPVVGRLSAALVPPGAALAGGASPSALAAAAGIAPAAVTGSAAAAAAYQAAVAGAPGAAAALTGAPAATLAAPGDDAQPSAPETFVSLSHVQGQMRQSSLTMVSTLVDNHPEEALSVLRRWLGPQEAGRA